MSKKANAPKGNGAANGTTAGVPKLPQKPLSHTVWSPYDTVRDVSDALGISWQLTDDVAKNLAMDVEYRIHEIIEQALKFMRHGKRRTLTTQDIERAMKVLNLEPLYGYDTSKPLVFKEAMIGPGQTLYYIDDDEVDFETLINQPLPKVPRHSTCTAHWLAVEGVQPTIPQNPNISDIRLLPLAQRGSLDNLLSLNNDEISLVTNPKTGVTTVEAKQPDKKELEVKPLVKHVLSKEMQLYFNKIIEVLMDENNENLKTAALESIRSDTGLHPLVPYLVQFIAETITHNLKNLNLLTTMLMLIYSLISNTSIFLDPYIHALMPCILTLLLAKNIGPMQSTTEEERNGHFQVRRLSASLLQKIIENYGSSYNTLKPRITRTLLRAFLSNTTRSSAGTQFGAILGMKSLGAEVIRIVFVGNLRTWSNVVLDNFDQNDENRALLLDQVLDCLSELKKDGQLVASGENSKKHGREGESGNDDFSMDVDEPTKPGESALDDDMKKKLEDRVGKTIASKIIEDPNALLLYYGLYFGEGC
jgi:transcription initiation factor TFIID subunit 6